MIPENKMNRDEQSSADRKDAFGKSLATLFGFCLLTAVMWPIGQNWANKPSDDFPLSYYPMFSAKRGEIYKVPYFIGLDDNGHRIPLSYKIAGTGGFNQVRRQLKKVVKGDANEQEQLCRQVAERVARKTSDRYQSISEVLIRTSSCNNLLHL